MCGCALVCAFSFLFVLVVYVGDVAFVVLLSSMSLDCSTFGVLWIRLGSVPIFSQHCRDHSGGQPSFDLDWYSRQALPAESPS